MKFSGLVLVHLVTELYVMPFSREDLIFRCTLNLFTKPLMNHNRRKSLICYLVISDQKGKEGQNVTVSLQQIAEGYGTAEAAKKDCSAGFTINAQ